jgi:polysaccharide export outer membrane protein
VITAVAMIAVPASSARTQEIARTIQPAAAAQMANTPAPADKTTTGDRIQPQSSSYRLGPGDRVRIVVYGEKDLSGEYSVDGSGMLSFPLIGQMSAAGLSADALARAIQSRLSPDYLRDPNVSAEILTYRPFYIVGEVKTPGSYPYVSGMTVLNAVALAGGFTYRARDDKFYLNRTADGGGKEQLDATPDSKVEPGDVITVRERYF